MSHNKKDQDEDLYGANGEGGDGDRDKDRDEDRQGKEDEDTGCDEAREPDDALTTLHERTGSNTASSSD